MKSIILLCLIGLVLGDVYMHNPRGSNDRLNEANENRNNANRLFDSQNNGKGGYCWGPKMSFYEGSLLQIIWTNQHGCGAGMLCNQVIQYMCSDADAPLQVRVRDGTTTDTIPDTDNGPTEQNGAGQPVFGMHEPRSIYTACKTRNRNMGLWISDREKEGNLSPGRAAAIFTRQNNNGNRHGYECAEERDYYPYWHPSPWKDIAVLASDSAHCDTFKSDSQNVADKNECQNTDGTPAKENTEVACNQAKKNWVTIDSHGIGAPSCLESKANRMNHLGYNVNGQRTHFNWTIPRGEACASKDNCNCVLRLRYNISTAEVDAFNNLADPGNTNLDWKQNAEASPVKEDPDVLVSGTPLTLAIDTSQFGRTFEDRSHVFGILHREDIPDLAKIYNLNVQGKRGNIVQAYPAVEYDFIPDSLTVFKGDYIHFQWTGCDTNPNGNAGEGKAGTDRSNIVQTKGPQWNMPADDDWLSGNTKLFPDDDLRKRMATIDQPVDNPTLCNPNTNNQNDVTNCKVLNGAATPYFNGGAVKMENTGNFYYISTRNNNFSNRDQKGTIHVNNVLPDWAIGVVVTGGVLFVGAAGAGAAMLYANSHPHSKVATVFSKL